MSCIDLPLHRSDLIESSGSVALDEPKTTNLLGHDGKFQRFVT